jgi:DNA-binding Lrp family transcriptional regulator
VIAPAPADTPASTLAVIDASDRAIVRATQAGLPLCTHPFHAVADSLGLAPADVLARMRRMLADGILRRIAAVPDHYRLGYTANGMTVWDVPDDAIGRVGPEIGALPFVSHCYHRPRHPPDWPYNLFAMVHGRSRDAVEAAVAEIAGRLGSLARAHEILYSTRILKKTGLRLVD